MVNSIGIFYEANPIVVTTLVLTPIITRDIAVTVFCIMMLAFGLYIYRYTPSDITYSDTCIVSPVCGVVNSIIKTPTHIFVSIDVKLYNRHYILYPCNGKVTNNSDVLNRCNILMNNYSLVQLTYNGKIIEYIGDVKANDYIAPINLLSNVTLLFPIRSPDGQSEFYLNDYIENGKKISTEILIGHYQLI